jgi:RNA polymerase sigma factor (sigma-70 family)
MNAVLPTDASLVAQSVAGNRPAFAQIVSRYQALVCSVAYSATGSLSHSEDLAQETFLSAWRQLRGLREPERLAGWLCGIARNLAHNRLRQDGREPAAAALPIEAANDTPVDDPAPVESAMRSEEQAILWRSLARIPETYREPLVLYYREQQSIERVAQSLELSEDAVRQRLSRGRKLLHEEVLAFVEGALERSSPGAAFTLAVVAALPALGTSTAATAAVAGATAAQGSGVAKSMALGAVALAVVGPLVGAASSVLAVQSSLAAAPTARERAIVWRESILVIGATVLMVAGLWALIAYGMGAGRRHGYWLLLGSVVPLGYAAWFVAYVTRGLRAARELRAQLHREARGQAPDPHCVEHRSAGSFLGLPWYHLRFGMPGPEAPPVRGWIAIGDRAVGVLAMGNVSVGLVSLGAFATGGLAIGGVAVGLLPIGGVSLGLYALAGAAFGWFAIGGYAVGWSGAVGGVAIAREFAGGGSAFAAHANDAIALVRIGEWLPGPVFPVLLGLAVLTLIPSAWYAQRMRRHAATRP